MIELIFSDSGAASLGIAKSTGDKSSICSVEISTDGEGNETMNTFAPEPYTGPTIDGDISDIAAIWLMGDVGDISVLPDWNSRLKIMRDISDAHAMETDEWVDQEGERAGALVQRLQKAAHGGEPVRIWWSDIPHETCGYYWAMSILKEAAGAITSIKAPRLWPNSDGFTIVKGTGELKPEDFCSLLQYEKPVEYDERRAIARLWKVLVSENAPLRAVLNGELRSVPEDFYDYVLYEVFPEENFKVAEAIGRALGKGPGGISDWWYARRIRQMIACGELEIIEEGKKFYYSTVRKRIR